MENPTASQTASSTCAQNLLLSLRNLQLNDDGIWADNNGGVSMSKINLSSDQFARHVFVKIITSCNYYHLQLITQKITSSDKHGASSIKKLIKVLSISKSPLICYVISALSRLFEDMMITKSGSSIITTLAGPGHKQGCISMIDFISEMSGLPRQQLLYIIYENSVALSKDPFGNFAVQHIIGLENPKFIELTCLALKGQFVDLSLTKCGSHIVEKLLKLKAQVVISYVANDFLNSNRILEVASDIYGNFVIQTALKESMRLNRLMYQRLVMKLQENPNSLKFGYGKHVYKFITGYSGFSTC
ncbi:hypothetical protein ACOSP7_013947 [Xanthoceras sorbifolium]